MLVLSRHIDEAIVIGEDIRIVVIELRGDKVRLAIDAPKNVEVDREEIRRAKREERDDVSKRPDLDVTSLSGDGVEATGRGPLRHHRRTNEGASERTPAPGADSSRGDDGVQEPQGL